ncbi:MAG: hypothetical protein PHY18_00160 [Dehalococcoidales bacterium]|nr:hypothetical protein [Dehalococcoidales bacterium]
MGNGFGGGRIAGRGLGGGMGFGFRGSSPPWPYVGIGRGGLPRHAYFFSGAAAAPAFYPQRFVAGQGYGVGASGFSSYPYASGLSPEQEIDSLRNQAETISEQLEQIGKRIHDLESEKQ